MTRMKSIQRDSWQWFKERAHGTHAKTWLAALSFSESSFFVIPPDILLVAILLAGSSRWIYYASFTTIVSVVGAVFGYVVGALFYDTLGIRIVELYSLEEEFHYVGNLFDNNAPWVIFLAAFTPIPYKVFVLSAGFFKIHFFLFILVSIVGRGTRYFLIAYLVHAFGEHVTRMFVRYSNIATAVVVIIVLILLFIYFGVPIIP